MDAFKGFKTWACQHKACGHRLNHLSRSHCRRCGRAAPQNVPQSLQNKRNSGAWVKGPPQQYKGPSSLDDEALDIYSRMPVPCFEQLSDGWAPNVVARVSAHRALLAGEPQASAKCVRIEQDTLAVQLAKTQKAYD